jgi:hypothetical protein
MAARRSLARYAHNSYAQVLPAGPCTLRACLAVDDCHGGRSTPALPQHWDRQTDRQTDRQWHRACAEGAGRCTDDAHREPRWVSSAPSDDQRDVFLTQRPFAQVCGDGHQVEGDVVVPNQSAKLQVLCVAEPV